MPPKSEESIFNSAVDGERYQGIATQSGEYRIRIYLMRAHARRNATGKYQLILVK